MSLESEAQAVRVKATQQWRELVHGAASGDEPSLAAVSKVAAALGIADAVAKLRADADIVRERDSAAADLAQANANIAEVLEPYGNEERFRGAVEAAENLANELRGAYLGYTQGLCFSQGLAAGKIRRLEAGRPDLFANVTNN